MKTKIAHLNDGFTSIEYKTIEELQRSMPEPYKSFCPIYEYNRKIIGRENVIIGSYEVIDAEDKPSVTNMDDLI